MGGCNLICSVLYRGAEDGVDVVYKHGKKKGGLWRLRLNA